MVAGGGSHSSKTVATSGTTPAASSLPEYVVRGTWTEAEQHKWTFRDDTRTYASEWAAIYNPYADKPKVSRNMTGSSLMNPVIW